MSKFSKSVTIEEIENHLVNFLKTNIVDKSLEVNPDSTFQSLKIDSLSIVEIILSLERKYQVTIPENELNPENLKSAKTLAACAYRCVQNG